MSLRERVLIILVIIFGGYLATEYAVHRWIVYPEYLQQEQQQARGTVEHALEAIEKESKDTQARIAEAARSGQFNAVLKNPRQTPPNSGLNSDFLLVVDYKGQLVWSDLTDNETRAALRHDLLESNRPLITVEQMGFSKNAICPVNGRYARIITEPILASPQSLTVEGMLIAGDYLKDADLQSLKDRLELSFSWQVLSPDGANGAANEIARSVTPQHPYHFSILGQNVLQCSTLLYDRHDNPALLIKTFQDRDLSAHGLKVIHRLLIIKAVIGLAAVTFLTLLLQHMVITPIVKLIRHIEKAGGPTSAKENLNLHRNDEIGTLAREFDHMCSRVQNAQIKLAEKSYYSGITEMSSGILHNVRNALSPITTRIERIKGHFRELPLQHLEQAQQELQDGALSPERRTDLIRFVELTFQNVMMNLKETVCELEELSRQAIQIEDMLTSQRTLSPQEKENPIEFIEPIQLIHKAMETIPEQTLKYCKIKTRQIEQLPAFPVHTTTFIQVLQNLLINAGESLQRQKSLCSKITVACEIESAESVDMLHWTIEDNGAGIEPEKLKSIFERGASSKDTALTGIGLHWCANTITAMRGKIWAESSGPHHGACFHILIPTTADAGKNLAGTKER